MSTAVQTKTWTITTTGPAITGHLPEWAEEDPSETGVPPDRLDIVLADICHYAEFSGQGMHVATDGGTGTFAVVLGGSIECYPYAEHAAPRIPVVNLQIIDDYWINNLDPDHLTEITAKLRVQADYLDHEIRPALIAARADWATHHTP
jgi:hypothetical protein